MIKKISLIAGTESTRVAILNQIQTLLGKYVHIDSYSIDAGINRIIKSDLVIVSTKLIIDECIDFIDKESPVIIARRSLNISNIDKIFSIDNGTNVLLVNDAIETSIETIDLLNNLGVDHINYIPYYPGCEIKEEYSFGITPGEIDLIPPNIKNVIDLGPRLIDLTTIIEILVKLDLLDEKANVVSAKYLETIVGLTKDLHGLIEQSNSVNDYLLKILNKVNDGIVVFNEKNIITVFNEKAEHLFKLHKSKVLNKNINQVLKHNKLLDYLIDNSNLEEQIFKYE